VNCSTNVRPKTVGLSVVGILINILNIFTSSLYVFGIVCVYGCVERLLQRDCKGLGDDVYVEPAPWPVSLDFRLI